MAAGLGACAATGPVDRPPIVAAAAWGSRPDPIPAGRRHRPVRITIHHAGVLWKADDDPYDKLRRLQAWGKRDKGWPDVPYHFLIAPDGRIFAGRDLAFEGETNTEYHTHGHVLVQLWGDFERQRVTRAQLAAATELCAWVCASFRIPPSAIAGHRDWSDRTSCPGRDLYRYLPDLRRWVGVRLGGGRPEVGLRPR